MIYINAGHSKEDSGATTKFGNLTESEFAMIVRDIIKKKLPNAIYVPDDLNLKQSIDWVNARANENDLAISIHFNANNNRNISGIEAYYSKNSFLANLFAHHVSKFTGMINRGAKHDSESYVGSLGWLRNLKCKSVLIECGYLSNVDDYKKISIPSLQKNIANGIISGIIEYRLKNELKGLLVTTINLLSKLVEELQKKLIKKLK